MYYTKLRLQKNILKHIIDDDDVVYHNIKKLIFIVKINRVHLCCHLRERLRRAGA
jgi:hypothetical protein